ncbi:MAG TPA: response regulator [Holophagaceae bacterium]|nr:response regulator [Holophagaceae bacterium]
MARSWGEGTTVLLVEDNLLTARMIRSRLEMEGLTVLEAHNGLEGLEIIRAQRVDLVSTDLMMPAMDGFRLIQEIRDMPPPKGKVPVLVVSSNQNEQDMVRCLAAGADDYITKPISPQVFIERMWRLHQRHGG